MSELITVTSSTTRGMLGWVTRDGYTPDIQDPCDFTATFNETLYFEQYSEVAITEIMYGPLFNIEDYNNRYTIGKGKLIQHFSIPSGYYASMIDIAGAIRDQLSSPTLLIKNRPTFSYKQSTTGCSLKINDVGSNFIINKKDIGDGNLLKYLGYGVNGKVNTIHVTRQHLPVTNKVAKISSDLVGETRIDDTVGNIFDTLPLQCSVGGYSCYTFQNPNYKALRVNELNQISIKISNMYGRKIDIQDIHRHGDYNFVKYPTIVKLHFRGGR